MSEENTSCCSSQGCDHQHGPTGAQIVKGLSTGFAVLSLVTPLVALLLLLFGAARPVGSLALPLAGVLIAALHLLIGAGVNRFVQRDELRYGLSPIPVVVRALLDESVRVGIALAAVTVLTAAPYAEKPANVGAWLGIGAALTWAVLATVQFVSATKHMRTPSDWSKAIVGNVLAQKVTPRRVIALRFIDLLGTLAYQLGACILAALSPVMIMPLAVLAIGSGLSRVVLAAKQPRQRSTSAWVYAAPAVGAFTLALALIV
ncbi:hypothetical protein ACUH91_07860 [Dermabacteraceae bacterium P9123]